MTKQIDPKQLRNVAGAFATGVTVVTVLRDDGSVHGMTANSFVSLSLGPPLVAFSVRVEGKMAKHLEVGKAVGISILSDQQKAVSNQFAGYGDDEAVIDMETRPNGARTIKGSLAWYATIIQDIITVGDHFMIICQVEDLHRAEQGSPLLYFSGYKTISSTAAGQ